jgi:autophagy-related protein 9
MALDEENLGYHDDDLDHAELFNGDESRMTTESTAFLARPHSRPTSQGKDKGKASGRERSKWMAQSPRLLEEEGDDDVPASLLIEGNAFPSSSTQNKSRARGSARRKKQESASNHGPSTRDAQSQWDAAQAQQRLHQEFNKSNLPNAIQHVGLLGATPKDRAMWRWINVVNLDNFIAEVYDYYRGAGMWCIILERTLNLLSVADVGSFHTLTMQQTTHIRGSVCHLSFAMRQLPEDSQ